MPTVQVTFEVPDTLSAEQVQQIIAQVNTFAQATTQSLPNNIAAHSDMPDVDDSLFPPPDVDGFYDPLVFAGAGRGRAGTVGHDVKAYLRDLRSDWDERDAR